MAVTDQQKLDFLLKKIGYTKTKTGSVVGTGAISGTPKQPFAEAIPSPLVVPNSSLWNEAASIPATAPGSDTTQVKVYLAASSGLRMTADSTSSGQRAYIAYTTYNNTSSARLTNWIDTQFGASYLIKVYKGDPNSGGVALSAAGSGSNDGWFFDYSAGVLNFNDTSVPSGVTDTNIYIVGYRYVGQTGAPTSGISTFSYLDLTVERNLDVGVQGGISTFRNNIDLNADLDVDGHTNLDNVSVAGVSTFNDDVTLTGASYSVLWDKSENALEFSDDAKTTFGDSKQLKLYRNSAGSTSTIENTQDQLNIVNSGTHTNITAGSNIYLKHGTNHAIVARANAEVEIYHNAQEKLATTSTGINVIGLTETDTLNTGDATFTGTVSAASTIGTSGQYLRSTGSGVAWASFPSTRSTSTQTATAGQTSFSFTYTVGYLDVFVNGVKLPPSEFTASNGSTVVLDDAAFVDDTLEFVSYYNAPGAGAGALTLNELDNVTITGSPVVGETLQHNGSAFVNDYTPSATTTSTSQTAILSLAIATYRSVEYTVQTVSYTHLTLPTNREV